MTDTTNQSRTDTAADGFTAEERAAMKERAAELKAAGRAKRGGTVDDEAVVLEKIAEMPESDRVMAERIHELVKEAAPELAPRTWYGMPAYAKDGKVLCYFQSAHKFKARYATLGFSDTASLDDGAMWPTEFAVARMSGEVAARVEELLRRAVGS